MCLYCFSLTLVTFLALVTVDGVNLFYRGGAPYNNGASGTMTYNNSLYIPTCGFKVIFSCNVPISITVWDYTVVQMDNYTFMLNSSQAGITGRTSSVLLSGQFTNFVWPEIVANYFCVCNSSTANACSAVPYQTASRPDVSTVVSTTSTTPVTTASSVARSSSLPSLTIADIFNSVNSTAPTETNMNSADSLCYTGSLYTTLNAINHFVDCCSLCCTYKACQGVNYFSITGQCDLIFELSTSQTSIGFMATLADCKFWRVTFRG
ncbi:hypothetical protein BgiMline_025275 [Biomphalaria glabrata]|nr:hypothetical protein BgiMline_031905 [Biomphalaria glabrata]